MRIAIGADHAGFPLKQHLVDALTRLGHQVDDRGTHSDAAIDYPPICADVARLVVAGQADRGIVVGGSGQGEQIAANKVRGIRAALCNELYTARMSRAHNDANILAIGGRVDDGWRSASRHILPGWSSTARRSRFDTPRRRTRRRSSPSAPTPR